MPQHAPAAPLFLAGNLALDFVNSQYGPAHARQEALGDDQAALAWLHGAGLAKDVRTPPRGLARRARALRAAADRLLRTPRSRTPDDLALVDAVRERGRPLQVLAWDASEPRPRLLAQRRDDGADALLEPVASALTQLLTEGDLARVRECEAHDCCLMFEDATKSGRRRWCSMALCGNRMKVAAFRSRQGRGAADAG